MSLRRALPSLILFAIAFTCTARADEPLPPPEVKEFWSLDRHYVAVSDPDAWTTTVFEVSEKDERTELWTMYGWFRDLHVWNDGEHLVAGYNGLNLLELDYREAQAMLHFFRRAEVIRVVR